ncbi:MAG: hypothetical protein JW881_07770 [Spirochaetales bacterium]|nr:hypothetical protein [Spirochaetales bacterium]
MITEKAWDNILAEIKNDHTIGSVYIIGGVDTGKTTLASFLYSSLRKHFSIGYIDCDPGQSTIGPPATIGLGIYGKAEIVSGLNKPDAFYLRFIGNITPTRHLLQTVSGIKRCAEKAEKLGVEKLIIDSSGFVRGSAAREFQFTVIDLIRPDYIIELASDFPLESLLVNFSRRFRIVSIAASQAVRSRSKEERRHNREERFRHYFTNTELSSLDTGRIGFHGMIPDGSVKDSWDQLLVALCNRNQFVISLGILQSFNPGKKKLTVLSPPFPAEKIVSIHFGSIRLLPSGIQLP